MYHPLLVLVCASPMQVSVCLHKFTFPLLSNIHLVTDLVPITTDNSITLRETDSLSGKLNNSTVAMTCNKKARSNYLGVRCKKVQCSYVKTEFWGFCELAKARSKCEKFISCYVACFLEYILTTAHTQHCHCQWYSQFITGPEINIKQSTDDTTAASKLMTCHFWAHVKYF